MTTTRERWAGHRWVGRYREGDRVGIWISPTPDLTYFIDWPWRTAS